MAEDKKSIIVYADWITKFEALTDDEAGRLIKHFFRYVNDLNPVAQDRITELSFIDIQQTLKRDLVKWEKRAERSRENGNKGGRPKTQDNPQEPKETQQVILEPRKPDSVNGSVSVSDNVNDISLKEKNEIEILEKPVYKKVEKDGITIYEIDHKTPLEVMFENMNRLEPILMQTKTSGDSKRIRDWSNWYINKYNDYYNKLPVQLGVSLKSWLEKPEPTFGKPTEPTAVRRANKQFKGEHETE